MVCIVAAGIAAAALLTALAGCAATAQGGGPRVVATTPMLGALVRELVGGRVPVTVVMPNGVDPHEFQPSARDATRLGSATLIVRNGLELEGSLTDVIARARDGGVPIFTAGDHVDVLRIGGDGTPDPHIWMDPDRMASIVPALARAVATATGLDLGEAPARLRARLTRLAADLRAQAATLPPARRTLITGHESLGYFADAFGFRVVGAIVPSLSSEADPTAARLADLRTLIRDQHIPAVFVEQGTPTQVALRVGEITGAHVVRLPTHALPADGSYETFMRDTMHTVVGALRA